MLHRFQVAQGLGDARDGQGGAALLSYVDRDERVPTGHPLRKIRQIVNDALYTKEGRTLIAPERLIWASLLQTPFSIRVTPHACLRHDTVVA